MPAYKVDWSDYNKHKSKGGSFKDYSKKEYQPINDEVLKRHFQGTETIGIYPLLEDNTSFFIAVMPSAVAVKSTIKPRKPEKKMHIRISKIRMAAETLL